MASGGYQSHRIIASGVCIQKCMEETVSVEDIQEGTLGPKLTQEDFDTALQVNFTYSAMFSMKNEVIMCNSCLT